jgi:serine/threonine-protein kinase
MRPEDWLKIKEIFDAAVLIPKDGRDSYLRDACGDDIELRGDVEALLASYDAAEGFMEKPFAGEIAELLPKGETDDLEPGQSFNQYRIVSKIGVGGMGKVYLAQDTFLRRSVALKLLSPEATRNAGQLARFIREARFASLLNHPNILTIYEIGHSGSLHFISSELVSGETLRDRIMRGPISLKEAINISIAIASALVVAHRSDIVHRDIKPENVMLREDGLLKVLDFGLAKLSRNERFVSEDDGETWDDVRTEPGLIMGTVTYMSPEQASGTELDARTDVWSLGVVLYEMIVGHPPFSGSSPAAIVTSILNVEPKPIDESSPHLRRRLRKIVKKSLAKLVEDRYQTIQEMLDDLITIRAEIGAGVAETRSLAVLPFSNVTGDARMSFFEFALADAVITELSRSRSIVVRPLSSVAKYLGKAIDPIEIGNELQVDAVLAANFVVSKNRIRVTTQLIDVGNRNVLWGEQIDSDADDVIDLEDTITSRIVEGLKCELETSAPPNVAMPATSNTSAYMEYLRGRDQLRRYMFHTVANENIEIALEHFRRAIELDPKFALAHCGLGMCFLQRVIKVLGSRADIEAASSSLDHALALAPHIIEARAYRAFILRLEGEVQKSRDQMIELRLDAPNNFEVHYLSGACYRFDGDYENAFRSYDEMLRIDPTAQVAVHYCRARLHWFQGDFGTASRELDLAERLEPNHPVVKFFKAVLTFHSGGPAQAVKELRNLLLVFPCQGFRPVLSMCLCAAGQRDAALRELTAEVDEIADVDPDVSYWLASANSMLGRADLAFKWLAWAIKLGNRNLPWFQRDPVLDFIRKDPRFDDLLAGLRKTTHQKWESAPLNS